MTTEALTAAGLAPTGLAGGRVRGLGRQRAASGADSLFVVEADEYDQAFLTLSPTVAIVNNVEADHLECYGTVDALEAAFVDLRRRRAPGRHRRRRRCRRRPDRRRGSASTVGAVRLQRRRRCPDPRHLAASRPHRTRRVRFRDGGEIGLTLHVPGLHNLRNAVAALLAVDAWAAPWSRR